MKRKVEVVPFSQEWHGMFLEEASKLRSVFGISLLNAYHIGSTSVPELVAKPIIDILCVVKDIEVVDEVTKDIEELGYEALGEYGIEGRRYFRKSKCENDVMTDLVHVHVFSLDTMEDIERHLAFRDYLCEHEEARKAYGELKSKLALEYPWDIESYCEHKNSFIKELEQKALAWYREE